MKKIWIAALLALPFAACQNDDVYGSVEEFEKAIGSTDTTETIKSIELDTSTLTETDAVVTDTTDASYNDYVENTSFDGVVYIYYNGDTATVEGDTGYVNISVSGAHVKVADTDGRICYVLSGSTTNGSLKVNCKKKFEILLNGVSIANPSGAAINNQCSKSL